jgi:hypothetical protein
MKFDFKKFIIIQFVIFLTQSISFAQDLTQERIWKISDRKKSLYFDKGIFHHPVQSTKNSEKFLTDIRNSYLPSRGYERIVFDISSGPFPGVYGQINKEKKILKIDLLNIKLKTQISMLKNSKFLSNLKLYEFNDERLSLEISFSKNVAFDIFYLESPNRLVIDIKEN